VKKFENFYTTLKSFDMVLRINKINVVNLDGSQYDINLQCNSQI